MERVFHVGELTIHGDRRLVLSDYYSAPEGVSNLACLKADGSEVWRAELRNPTMGHYVSMETEGEQLFANSFDAYYVELDPATGSIISQQFTK